MIPASRRSVLIVDDDGRMRALQRRVLEKAGYHVVEAECAPDALALLKRGTFPNVVIADLEMPAMTGDEMVRRIRRTNPDQKVLYVTGNLERLMKGKVALSGSEIFLDKPFTTKSLLDAISQLLQTPVSARRSPLNAEPPGRVLVVDDLPANIELIRRVLSSKEFEIDAASSADGAAAMVAIDPPDVILLDIRMPGRDGFDLCRALKSDDSTRLIPVILMTGNSTSDDRLRAIEAGADDFIAKPLNPGELRARVRALARVKRHTDELENAEQVIISLALTIEARDPTTNGHCQRLARYASELGEALGLDREDVRALHRGGYLHDLGKIGIPDAVLSKRGPLTSTELEVMRTHPVIGERLCGELRSLVRVRPIVRSHHERLDGSGYPDGLRGAEIPLLAEIMGLVDVFDALTTTRPYRAALPFDEAARTLREEVERGWRRKELVELLLETQEAQRADA